MSDVSKYFFSDISMFLCQLYAIHTFYVRCIKVFYVIFIDVFYVQCIDVFDIYQSILFHAKNFYYLIKRKNFFDMLYLNLVLIQRILHLKLCTMYVHPYDMIPRCLP